MCPDSWWHYAVSLSPSITLMCNFWDVKNRAGLREMAMKGCRPMAQETPLSAPRCLTPRSRDSPIVLRESPDAEASVVGALRVGESANFHMEAGAWLATTTVGGVSGWARATDLVAALVFKAR